MPALTSPLKHRPFFGSLCNKFEKITLRLTEKYNYLNESILSTFFVKSRFIEKKINTIYTQLEIVMTTRHTIGFDVSHIERVIMFIRYKHKSIFHFYNIISILFVQCTYEKK